MSPRLILRRLAETDIADAADWYDSEQPDLAARFLSDIDQAFARIRERPLQFPVVSGDVRRALMHTFP
jgi:plasmid stabilization system protein ParE